MDMGQRVSRGCPGLIGGRWGVRRHTGVWARKPKAAPEEAPLGYCRLGDCFASLAMSAAKRPTVPPWVLVTFPLPLERERVRVRE